MEELKQLLKDLGSDATLAAEYEKDPDAVMMHRGIDEEARKAMKEKDTDAVRRLAGLRDVHLTNSTITTHG